MCVWSPLNPPKQLDDNIVFRFVRLSSLHETEGHKNNNTCSYVRVHSFSFNLERIILYYYKVYQERFYDIS